MQAPQVQCRASGNDESQNPTPYSLQPTPTPYTLHPTPYTLYPTPHTLHLHPTPYSLHPTLTPTPYTSHQLNLALTLQSPGRACLWWRPPTAPT